MKPRPEPTTQPASASELQRRLAILYHPDGTPLHWSEAAKYPYGLYPRSTAESAAPPVSKPVVEPAQIEPAPQERPVEPVVQPAVAPPVAPAIETQAPSVLPVAFDRVPWSGGVKILVLITVLLLGAAVVPFCVMNWESIDWSDWFGASTTAASSATAGTAEEASQSDEHAIDQSATEEPHAFEVSASFAGLSSRSAPEAAFASAPASDLAVPRASDTPSTLDALLASGAPV